MDAVYKRITAMLLALVLAFVVTPIAAQPDGVVTITNSKTGKEYTFTSIALGNLKLLEDVVDELNMNEHLETLQGIMLVETRAGTGGSIGLPTAHWTRRSYGLMQITLPTARVILRDNPDILEQYFGNRSLTSISLDELKRFLLSNKRANIHLGAVLFKQYLDIVKNEWARAVAGYNMGIGNALKRKDAPQAKYVRDVREMQRLAKALNKQLMVARAQPSITPPVYEGIVDLYIKKEDSEYTLPTKENNNGEGEEIGQQTHQESSPPQRSERAEEAENSFSNYHASFSSDRRSEGSDQGNNRGDLLDVGP
jgi:hypothetical protein